MSNEEIIDMETNSPSDRVMVPQLVDDIIRVLNGNEMAARMVYLKLAPRFNGANNE